MNLFARLFSLCAALAATALPVAARPPVLVPYPAPGHRLQFDPHKFMRVGDLRPGMRGYALTVFHGTKIERFGVEILGVVQKYNEGQDYILFRATSGPPVTDHLNIAHGMSGSPIYIHGKLVGAISMELSNGTQGPSFPRDPIGLATPIESMFDAWSPDLPTRPSAMSARPSVTGAGVAATTGFTPLDTPVTVSGVTPDGIAQLGVALAPYHLALSAGGGGGGTAAKNLMTAGQALQPGAAVGVSLMQGDMDFTATGTVTYRDGDRVLLFGHPFFDLGPIDAALTTASVVGIYPSYEDSVKIGQPLQTVGRIFQDRPFSVGGVIGSLPQMIPMTVAVDDQSIKRRRTFHVRIINHPLLTGQFVPMVAQQAIEQVHGLPGDSMATVTLDADVEEIGHVRRTNTFYDGINIDQAASTDLVSLVQTLQSNPFYPLALKSVRMGITIRNGHDTAEVDHIFLRQSKFRPGDTVSIGVVLKPYKRALLTQYISVKIPANTPDGPLTLSVAGGGDGAGGGINIGGLILVTSSAPTEPSATIAQLVRQFEDRPANNTLVADLTLPTSALVINGQKLSDLPPTLAGVIQSTRSTGIQTERDEVKVTQPSPYIISGSQSLTITVQKRDAPAPNPGGGGAGGDGTPTADASPALNDGSSGEPALALPPTVGLPLAAMSAPFPQSAPPALALAGGGAATGGPSAAPSPAAPAAPAPAASGAGGGNIKPVGRLPTVWRQDTMADFASGNLEDVSVSSAGDVRLSAAMRKVADTPESYVWAIQPDGHGGAYLGTGDRGIIYRMAPDGKVAPFFKTDQLEVTALALDGEGNLYAGTAPNGIVYRVAPDGKGAKFISTQEKYVTALVASPAGLYAATGGGTGRVYYAPTAPSLTPQTQLGPPLFTSPEAHILSLAMDKDGNVYAGSSPDGIIYKLSANGQHRVFYATPQPNIASLATDSQGNVYAGTSPDGNVYKITPDGTAKALLSGTDGGILGLRTDASDDLYACAGNTITRITPDGTTQAFTADSDEQFLTLATDGGSVYAGTGTVGSVYRLGGESGPLQGQYISGVHDAGRASQWGTLSWMADTPPETHVMLQTRSGDVSTPDESWSDWSSPMTQALGAQITSPGGRYLQYRATLTRGAGAALDAVPRLFNVTAYYLTRNRPPTVHLVNPVAGAAVHKAVLVRWTGSDPDNDTLSYDLSYSSDAGWTWTPIAKRAAPSGPGTVTPPPAAGVSPAPVTEQEVQDKTRAAMAALDKANPSLPPNVRRRLEAQTADAIRAGLLAQRAAPPAGTPPTGATGSGVKETSFSWDTADVPDGIYQVRVTASDRPSNPVGWLTNQSLSSPFQIANTLPTLTLGTATVNADRTLTVPGTAQAKAIIIQAVQGHADDGDDIAALANDGIFDASSEPFTLTLGPLSSGMHTVTVEAIDQAGNTATAMTTVKVP